MRKFIYWNQAIKLEYEENGFTPTKQMRRRALKEVMTAVEIKNKTNPGKKVLLDGVVDAYFAMKRLHDKMEKDELTRKSL